MIYAGLALMLLAILLALISFNRFLIALLVFFAGFSTMLVARSSSDVIGKAYREAAANYKTLLECTSDGFWVVELESGKLAEVNDAYVRMSGFAREELLSMKVADIEANENPEEVIKHILKVVREGNDLFESRHRTRSGRLIDVEVSAICQPEPNLIICFLRDITERKFTENRLRLFASVFEASGEGIMITDSGNRIEKVNQAFTRLTGYEPEEVMGRNPSMLSSGLQGREFYSAMWERLLSEGLWQGEIWDRRKDGNTYPKWLSISVVRNGHGEIVNYIGSFSDIAELKKAEMEIEQLAYHDPLTGLPNRFSLFAKLEQALARSRRDRSRLALMFIDLDRFKIINDTLGHHIGDQLIAQVGNRLRKAVRESDVVARLGGGRIRRAHRRNTFPHGSRARRGEDTQGFFPGLSRRRLQSFHFSQHRHQHLSRRRGQHECHSEERRHRDVSCEKRRRQRIPVFRDSHDAEELGTAQFRDRLEKRARERRVRAPLPAPGECRGKGDRPGSAFEVASS